MAREIMIKPAGLYTDPNPHSDAPPGALRRAEEVVIRRAGQVQPRPGFKDEIAGGWAVPSTTPRALHPFAGDTLIGDSANAAYWLSDGDQITTGPSLQPPTARPGQSAQSRGSLYVTTAEGIAKIEASGVTAARYAGMPQALSGVCAESTTGTPWLAAAGGNDSVAYRIVYRREDANGYILRGPPSGRFTIQNTAVAARSVAITVPLHSDLIAGDTLEIYRSLATNTDVITGGAGTPPSDDLFLAHEYQLDAADISAGSTVPVDVTPEEALGATLYTSPSQQGALAANAPPPRAALIEPFRGSMFYGDTEQHATHALELAGDTFTMVGRSDITVSSPASVAVLTFGTGTTAGLRIGMYVCDNVTPANPEAAGTFLPAYTKIASIDSSTQITCDKDALSTGLTALIFCPVLEISAVSVEVIGTDQETTGASPNLFDASTGDNRETVRSLVKTLNFTDEFRTAGFVAADTSADEQYRGALTIAGSRVFTGGGMDVLVIPHEPWLSGTTDIHSGTAADAVVDDFPGRLYWSKTDEPEAVPIVNYVDVGDATQRIRALLSTEEVLWVCKDDGAYALTGFGADSGWRVDPHDAGLRALHPNAAWVVGGRAFVWSSRGVVTLPYSGGALSSAIDDELAAIESALSYSTAAELGVMGAACETEGELWLGVPAAAGNAKAAAMYILNVETGAWTKSLLAPNCLAHDPASDTLLFGTVDGTDLSVRRERKAATYIHGDRSFSPTVTSVAIDGVTVQISAGSGWTPAVGDAFIQTQAAVDTIFHVVSFASATVFTVDRAGVVSVGDPSPTWTAYEGYTCRVEFTARGGGDPTSSKLWQGGGWHFETTKWLHRVTTKLQSDRSTTQSSALATVTMSTEDKPRHIQYWGKRNHGRAVVLYPEIQIAAALSPWRLTACACAVDAVSEKVERRSV